MIRPGRLAAFLLSAAGVCGVLYGCGGKLAPLDDAGADAEAEADADAGIDAHEAGIDASFVDGALVITSLAPSSGPNSGGSTVTVYGAGFATDGGTQITFAGFPAASASCPSDTQCVAVTPYPGPSDGPQVVHVRATLHGELGGPGTLSSAERSEDLFTYLTGPSCTGTLTCEGPYFPKVVVDCKTSVNFFVDPMTGSQKLVATGTSYAADTSDLGGIIAACNGTPALGSCTTYSIYEALWSYCGAPDFCEICTKWHGGICNPGPPPTCSM
ncbi:MAG TPA: IPT/TIG domain-containing protein [Polyangiaceae bacterium]|nr:IPT/TIG domain-containing protein [Polyangiaceae bacterium]